MIDFLFLMIVFSPIAVTRGLGLTATIVFAFLFDVCVLLEGETILLYSAIVASIGLILAIVIAVISDICVLLEGGRG